MHDQCHRLNNLILTFLANFVKGQSSARKKEDFGNLFNIAMGILRTVKNKKTKNTLTNNKVGICKTFVCEFCGHAFHS